MNVKRLQKSLEEINCFGYVGEGISRLAYTEAEQQAMKYLITQFKNENMSVKIDAVGNIVARREGTDPTLPSVACGSHIDTVYNAGRFDGTAGVVAGLEMIRSLNERHIKTKHPIEVIVFACEESSRFGVATIGSKVMTGIFNKDKLTGVLDKDGVSLQEALRACGFIDEVETARREKSEIKVFYELHVEQGPVLEKEEKQIGIATGIAAPTRFKLQINGQAAHSGSTPMTHRKDAFSGTAEIALALENAAYAEASYGTVATIGNCVVRGGAMNVVPGTSEIIIDIRSISETSKKRVVGELYHVITEVEKKRGLSVQVTKLCDERPIRMNENVIFSLKESCEKHNFSHIEMASGAGHDAMNMAKVFPTGLIFVPSKDGLSHHKDEFTSMEQLFVGATLLQEEILKVAQITSEAYC